MIDVTTFEILKKRIEHPILNIRISSSCLLELTRTLWFVTSSVSFPSKFDSFKLINKVQI